MSREDHDHMGTADLVAGAERRQDRMQPPDRQEQPMDPRVQQPMGMQEGHAEPLAALFPPDMSSHFRSRWDQVQIGFVDDPRRAVQQADELVADVMKSLAGSFADQRSRVEQGIGQGGEADTENLRVALRSYRSFFQRLLSL